MNNGKKRYFVEVTFRPAKELEALRQRNRNLKAQLARMGMYADLSLSLTDQLREAKRRLDALGQDTSFIRLRG